MLRLFFYLQIFLLANSIVACGYKPSTSQWQKELICPAEALNFNSPFCLTLGGVKSNNDVNQTLFGYHLSEKIEEQLASHHHRLSCIQPSSVSYKIFTDNLDIVTLAKSQSLDSPNPLLFIQYRLNNDAQTIRHDLSAARRAVFVELDYLVAERGKLLTCGTVKHNQSYAPNQSAYLAIWQEETNSRALATILSQKLVYRLAALFMPSQHSTAK